MTARSKNANTPETDRELLVPHIVTLDDGITQIEVEATDPLDAIQIVRARLAKGECQ